MLILRFNNHTLFLNKYGDVALALTLTIFGPYILFLMAGICILHFYFSFVFTNFTACKMAVYLIRSQFMAFVPDKPMHRRFVFSNLNSMQYKTYAKQYSRAKAGGIRCVYVWMSGTGVVGVVTDFGKGIVVDSSKRKLAAVCINAGAYILSPAVVVFTNASKLVNISKNIHSTASFFFECVEDSTNLAFLPLDIALFGQPIPLGAPNRFNLFSNHTDFLDV